MRTVRVIPCLDVDAGRVVKGVKFENLRDAGDPVELAALYAAQGADEVVFLDITASAEERRTMVEVVRETAEQVFIPLTVGGGVRSVEDARDLLRAGAEKVGVNTAAVNDPALIRRLADEFGSQCVVVSLDARRVGGGASSGSVGSAGSARYEVYTHGGRNPSGIEAVSWARICERLGAGEILLTSMDADGGKEGFDLELTRLVSDACRIPVIASGGVGRLQDLVDGALEGGADAVLAASIFHYGQHTVAEAKAYMAERGVSVRPAE